MMDRDLYPHLARDPEAGSPLVLAFHGTGGDEHQFFDLVPDLLPGAGVVAPRGDVSEGGANRFFRRTGEGVYDMADLARATDRMARFIAAHRRPGVPLYGLGYSNGANILASVLISHPGLVSRAVLMHPLIPWTPAPQPGLRGTRVLVTAGTRDPICPLPLTERFEGWLQDQGAVVTRHHHSGGHEVRHDELAAIAAFLRAPD